MASVTRRAFVGAVAAGAALSGAGLGARGQDAGATGASGAGGAGASAGVGTPVKGVLKVGLIGCGGRGTGAAVNALAADGEAVLWSLGDAFGDRVEGCLGAIRSEAESRDAAGGAAAGAAGALSWRDRVRVDDARKFTGFGAFKSVIESGVDVVLLASPPGFRPGHLEAAVSAGKHVFCEKPMATDGPGVRSVLASARRAKASGLSLMSGFCWRYNNAERALMEQIAGGAIGELRSVWCTYNAGGFPSPRERQPGWSDAEHVVRNWHYYTALSGDHIVEQAVHSIDWINWVMNAGAGDGGPEGSGLVVPARCVAVGGRQARVGERYGNIYDHFSATYEYASGVRAFHMSRHWPNSSNDNSAVFMGSRGVADMKPWTPAHVITGESAWRYRGPGSDMYQREHDDLFASIRAGRAHNDGEWMARSTLMGIMGRMAAYTGQTVTWEQAMNSGESLVDAGWYAGPVTGAAAMADVALPGTTKLL